MTKKCLMFVFDLFIVFILSVGLISCDDGYENNHPTERDNTSWFSEEELKTKGLEGLKGQIPGLLDISVRTECLKSSTVDVMLDTTFESAEALKNYSVHEKHVEVANTKVRPYTATRACMDYEI